MEKFLHANRPGQSDSRYPLVLLHALFVLTFVASLGPASASSNGHPNPVNHAAFQADEMDKENDMDGRFWFVAMQDVKADIRESQMASKNGASDFVRGFGRLTLADSQQMLKDVAEIGVRHPVMSPALVDGKHAATYRRLYDAKGTAFDIAFKEIQNQRLIDSIKLYESELKLGVAQHYRMFAKRNLPEIRRRLKILQGKAKLPKTPVLKTSA